MFFGPRESSAERIQVTSFTCYGFQRKSSLDVSYLLMLVTAAELIFITNVLNFDLVSLSTEVVVVIKILNFDKK